MSLSPVSRAFAASLRDLREKRHWTQPVLSEKSGVSAAAISNLEREVNGASLTIAVPLARALGTTVDAMAAGETEVAREA